MAVQCGTDPNNFLPPDPDAEPTTENDAEALSLALKAYHAANG